MNSVTRIERDKGTDVVFVPSLFGDDEVVVPKGQPVFVTETKVLRGGVRLKMRLLGQQVAKKE